MPYYATGDDPLMQRELRFAQTIYKISTVVRFVASTLISGREKGLERKGENL
jgi:hypothetical protein